jgi:hypothetical protein
VYFNKKQSFIKHSVLSHYNVRYESNVR